MKAGKEIGLIPSFHGDELNNLESGQLAAEVGARAVSHLEYVPISLFSYQSKVQKLWLRKILQL